MGQMHIYMEHIVGYVGEGGVGLESEGSQQGIKGKGRRFQGSYGDA